MDGILIIKKPQGYTSFDIVAKVRKFFNTKKVGHTGTLDPMATGVLVLCLGRATKLIEYLMKDEKEYVGEVTLGATSNTDDAEGEIKKTITNTITNTITKTETEKVIHDFIGDIKQMPPQFSAKKIKGQRAYDIARKGEKADLKESNITVHNIKLMSFDWPVFKMHVHCGAGTYIRSLARDIGEKLGCGGYLSSLLRTKVGDYTLEQACTLETMNETSIMPMYSALKHLESYNLSDSEYKILRDGKKIPFNSSTVKPPFSFPTEVEGSLLNKLIVGMRHNEAAIIIKVENGQMKLEKLLLL